VSLLPRSSQDAAVLAVYFALVAACSRAPRGSSPVPSEASGAKIVTGEPADPGELADASREPGAPSGSAPPAASARTPEEAARAGVLAATSDPDVLRRLASPAGLRVCKHFVSPSAPGAPTTCVTYTPAQLADAETVRAIRDVAGA
jgi:hypothetical protein